MDNANQSGSGVPPEPRDDRLTSWKEIASYLEQGVTTVQRWEQDRGLPIYRQTGRKRAPVYAYKSELDDWWRETGSLANGHSQKEAPGFPLQARSVWLVLTLGVAASFTILMLRDSGAGAMPSRRTIATLRFDRAAVSPDGRWLAYTDVANFHLRVRDLRDGSDRVLVDDNTASLAWAHDSRRLAYVRRQLPSRSLEIVDTRSGEVSIVLGADAPGDPFLNPADWSPDDKWLLGAWPGADRRISIGFLRIQDGFFSPRFDLPPRVFPSFLRLSPDGRFVAYSTRRDNNQDIYLAPLEGGGEEIRLTRDPQPDREPVWSPDGRYVLFDRRHGSDGDNSLWAVEVMRPSGAAEPVRIGDLGYQSWTLRKSFDAAGNLLVGSHQELTRCQVIEVDPATGLPVGRRISDFPEYSSCNDWSADGNSLSYTNLMLSSQSPEPVRVVRDLTTNSEHLETSVLGDKQPQGDPRLPKAPRNVPDYRWRYYSERRQPVVFRYDMETGQTEPFWESEEMVIKVSIAPNADYLAIRTMQPGQPGQRGAHGVWLMRLADKEVRKVATTRLGPTVTWSRNGTELAFADANCLMVMQPEDPQPTRLACTTAPDIPDTPSAQWPPLTATTWLVPLNASWSPDGKKLSWSIPVAKNRRVELWIIDRATGEHEVAVEGEPDYYTLPWGAGWSPNGKWLALDLSFFPDHTIQALSGVLPIGPGSVPASSSPL